MTTIGLIRYLVKNQTLLLGNISIVLLISGLVETISLLFIAPIMDIITLSSKGSLIIKDEKVLEINAEPVNQVIDTTGAGDLFAAGFLYGMTRQKSLEESGRWASKAAGEIISHYGVRPKIKLSSLI